MGGLRGSHQCHGSLPCSAQAAPCPEGTAIVTKNQSASEVQSDENPQPTSAPMMSALHSPINCL